MSNNEGINPSQQHKAEKKTYLAPAILSRQSLEAVATGDCTKTGLGDGDCTLAGPAQS